MYTSTGVEMLIPISIWLVAIRFAAGQGQNQTTATATTTSNTDTAFPTTATTTNNTAMVFPFIPCDSFTYLPFHCADKTTCIDRYSFCDDIVHCPDGSDEIEHSNATLSLGIQCQFNRNRPNRTQKFCHLPDRYKCDHELDCVGGQDECNCRHTFQCNNSDCLVKIQFCDGASNCADGTDEAIYNRFSPNGFQCPVSKRHETRNCVLPNQYVCDGDSDCQHGIDECFCDFNQGGSQGSYVTNSYSNEACFRCLDNSLIIPQKQLCDGIINCQDLSDECICSQKRNHVMPAICDSVCLGDDCSCRGRVQCLDYTNTSICLRPSSICDSRRDCLNGIDEQFCPEDDQNTNCSDGKQKIRKTRLCNGFRDCWDGSDEEDCHSSFDYFCQNLRVNFPVVEDWDNRTQTNLVAIPPGVVLSTGNPFYANRCDGEPTCLSLEDECYANGAECVNKTRPEFCQHVFSPGSGLRCNNSRSVILGKETCDGFPTCNDTHPAESIDELFCPNRFYCEDRGRMRLPVHIPLTSRCDQIQDCADQSDELDCSESTHFYCSKTSFIRRSEVCDGTMDCSSGVDECQDCTKSPFSSDEKLISNRVLVAFLWIIGLVSMVGNFAVIIHQLKNLISPEGHVSQVAGINRILVLNLAIADLLVGIYLVALGIKDASVSRYCVEDNEWRTSATCSGIGTIALIGTEASIVILLGMTSYRLFIVSRPFSKGNRPIIIAALLLSWTFALVISLVPHSSSLQDYFVSCVWFETNKFFGSICKKDLKKFTSDLYLRYGTNERFSSLSGGTYNWNSMFDAVAEFNSTYRPERYFGYYSAHGVCLPRLFPEVDQDLSWGYSLFLVIFNFFAFVFILVAYVVIYRTTVKRHTNLQSADRVDKRSLALQRKITRIVASNFCCWMPICIMAFLKVSGFYISDIAYSFTAIILLPINSAMNPFLYSDIVDIIWEQLLPFRNWCNTIFSGRSVSGLRGVGVSPTTSPTRSTAAANTKSISVKDDGNAETTL